MSVDTASLESTFSDVVVVEYRQKPARHKKSSSKSRRWLTGVNLALLLVPVIALIVFAWQHRWVSDDAFINFRIVDNLVHGHGPVFNAGERVEAGTSTLWIGLLAIFDVITFGISIEWWSVILGIAGAIGGILAAQRAALGLSKHYSYSLLTLPLGALALVVLRPMWDFTTSGLENGLSFAWIGISFWLLARVARAEQSSRRQIILTGAVVSLATLVRPDLGIIWLAYSAAFLFALPNRTKGRVTLAIVSLLFLPVVYEVFRMAYFAALVPNTAIAKEASTVRVHEGWRYLRDFVGPYWLAVPLLACVIGAAFTWPWRERRQAVVLAAPAVGGLLHAAYIVIMGGDYMHGRMLLPSLFAIVCPVMAIRVTKKTVFLAVVVVPWAVICALSLHKSYPVMTNDGFIVDERQFYINRAATNVDKNPNTHPVTLNDYRHVPFVPLAEQAKTYAQSNPRVFELVYTDQYYYDLQPLNAGSHQKLIVDMGNLGMYGVAAGPDVFIADPAGLGDPLAARVKLDTAHRGKPGHEKDLPTAWYLARFSTPNPGDAGQMSAAHALSCPPLHNLLQAVDAPLTPSRLLSNFVHAAGYTKLRIPADPTAAERQVCG
jgi:arabinofuranosyltransferase